MFRWSVLLACGIAVTIVELLRAVFFGSPNLVGAYFTMLGAFVALLMIWVEERRANRPRRVDCVGYFL